MAASNNGGIARQNVAIPLDYDMLATAASDKNLIDPLSLTRPNVASKIKTHIEVDLGMNVVDLPLVCPTLDSAMLLYNISLAQEMKLFPDRGEEDSAKLNATFHKRLETKKFCNVDVDKLLQDDGWKKFFRSLST